MKFKQVGYEIGGVSQVASWSSFFVNIDSKKAIKKLTISVEAGEMAFVIVDFYDDTSENYCIEDNEDFAKIVELSMVRIGDIVKLHDYKDYSKGLERY